MFSEVCRRFHGILFHPKALGSVTLNSLGKRAAMDAVRCSCRDISDGSHPECFMPRQV